MTKNTKKYVIEDLMDKYDESIKADPNLKKRQNDVETLRLEEARLAIEKQEIENKIALKHAEAMFEISKVGTAVNAEAERSDRLESKVDKLEETVAELKAVQDRTVTEQPPIIVTPSKLGIKEQQCKLSYEFKFVNCYKDFWNIDLFKKKAENFLKNGEGKWYRYNEELGTHHIIVDDLVSYNESRGLEMCIAQTAKNDRPQYMKRKKEWKVPPFATLRMIPSWFFTGVTGLPVVADPIENLMSWRKYHNFCIDNLEHEGIPSGSPLAYTIIRGWALENAAANKIPLNNIL